MHLFIDTNILLNLYTYPDDDDGVVDELIANIGPDQIVLHLPKQVENEFERNRESKLHGAVFEFKKGSFPTGVPNHMRGTEAANNYKAAIKLAEQARTQLIGNATSLALQNALPMDLKIFELFGKADKHEENDEVFRRALERAQRGNPPGKGDGVGDRYNWETLLEHVPAGDLYIISKDGDYASELSNFDKKSVRPKRYLSEEWSRLKESGSLHIYTTIKAVIDHYKQLVEQKNVEPPVLPPQIPLAPPPPPIPTPPPPPPIPFVPQVNEKDPESAEQVRQAIRYLEESGSFATTHAAISNLQKYTELFDPADATLIFKALDNPQVGWILSDSDVYDFYLKLTNRFLTLIDPELVNEVVDAMGLLPSSEDPDPNQDG